MKKLTLIPLLICCFVLVEAEAIVKFDDGGVHDIDYIIDDSVWVGHFIGLRSVGAFTVPTIVNLLPDGETGFACACSNGILSVQGGTVGGHLHAAQGVTTMSGGKVYGDVIASYGGSTFITGGWIGGELRAGLGYDSGGTITLVGTNFAVDNINIDYGRCVASSGTLTGVLASGETLESSFRIATGHDIILVEFIPEPATLLLLGLGSLFLLRRRR